MLYNDINYQEFIKFTNSGIQVATYTEVRAAITKRYKEIYGADIEISTASADGQFIEMMSLIINNILNSVKAMYMQLDPSQANGIYLDKICSLTNVVRKSATKSIANLVVTLRDTSSLTVRSLVFVDKAGIEWNYLSDTDLTLEPDTPQTIKVECSQYGPVDAPEGWIYQTLENLPIAVSQSIPAELGSYEETDEELRQRRSDSLSYKGTTSIESLKSTLLAIEGIEDAYIQNVTDNVSTNEDGTSLSGHTVYVCLKQRANVDIPDSVIGSAIYEKLTPGIPASVGDWTNHPSTTGTKQSFSYPTGLSGVTQTVEWKKCTPVNPRINITLTKLANYDNNTAFIIMNNIIDYCNSLDINTDLLESDIFMRAVYADPKFQGKPTYIVKSVVISGASLGKYSNLLTYYKYSLSDNPASIMISYS